MGFQTISQLDSTLNFNWIPNWCNCACKRDLIHCACKRDFIHRPCRWESILFRWTKYKHHKTFHEIRKYLMNFGSITWDQEVSHELRKYNMNMKSGNIFYRLWNMQWYQEISYDFLCLFRQLWSFEKPHSRSRKVRGQMIIANGIDNKKRTMLTALSTHWQKQTKQTRPI